MSLFRRLAIALCRFLFARRPHRIRQRSRRPVYRNPLYPQAHPQAQVYPDAYDAYLDDAYRDDAYRDEYEPFQDYEAGLSPLQGEYYFSGSSGSSHDFMAAQSHFWQPAYASYSLPQMGYYPVSFEPYPVDDEDEDEYEEDEAADLDAYYGTVEYRLEVFGGDAFIEFSYEGDLDEQQVINALNVLWASSPNRQNHVSSGTLRLPLSYNLPAY